MISKKSGKPAKEAMRKFALVAGLIFFAFVVWVIYQANTGFRIGLMNIQVEDKLGHFAIFGLLSLLFTIGSGFKGFVLAGRKYYWAAVAVLGFAAVEELSQAFIPVRTFDWYDFAADVGGVITASLICLIIERYVRHRKSQLNIPEERSRD